LEEKGKTQLLRYTTAKEENSDNSNTDKMNTQGNGIHSAILSPPNTQHTPKQ